MTLSGGVRRIWFSGVFLFAGAARAGDEPPAKPRFDTSQRNLGFFADIGAYSGFGGGVRAGTRTAGVEGSYGWLPILIALQNTPADSPHFEFFSTGQANAAVYWLFFKPGPRADAGLTLGWKYDTLLGHGAGVGGYAQVDLTRALALHVYGGLSIYPRGEPRLRDTAAIPDDAGFAFPSPNFQLGAGGGLVLFP